MNDVAVVLFALTDIRKIEAEGVRVSPAAALLLELIAEYPSACRWCLPDVAMAMLSPWQEHAHAAVDLAFAVESRIAWLTSSRAA